MKKNLSRSSARATTVRFEPLVQERLASLQPILGISLNRIVNEAVQGYLDRKSVQVRSELRQILDRLDAYRRSDPGYKKAMREVVDAEARYGKYDPAEGRSFPGPAQKALRKALRG